MLTGIIDTHAHYNDDAFAGDIDRLLGSLQSKGVEKIINCGTDEATTMASLALAERYDFIFAAAGIHPEDCVRNDCGTVEDIKRLSSHKKCVAIGEIGLDYYWTQETKELQRQFFEEQLALARELDKPVIIHDREAHGDTLGLIKKYRPKGVLHCFSGSVEMMEECLKLGMYIGLGGAVTYKNAKKPVAAALAVPADRLLLETDCPYMPPVPHRGERNDSSLIAFTAAKIAEIRNEDTQKLINTCADNSRILFGI